MKGRGVERVLGLVHKRWKSEVRKRAREGEGQPNKRAGQRLEQENENVRRASRSDARWGHAEVQISVASAHEQGEKSSIKSAVFGCQGAEKAAAAAPGSRRAEAARI